MATTKTDVPRCGCWIALTTFMVPSGLIVKQGSRVSVDNIEVVQTAERYLASGDLDDIAINELRIERGIWA